MQTIQFRKDDHFIPVVGGKSLATQSPSGQLSSRAKWFQQGHSPKGNMGDMRYLATVAGENRKFFDGKRPMVPSYHSLMSQESSQIPVLVDGDTIVVDVDGEFGPPSSEMRNNMWSSMSLFEREAHLVQYATAQRRIKVERAQQLALEAGQREAERLQIEAEAKVLAMKELHERKSIEWQAYLETPCMLASKIRCEQELKRKVPTWERITQETVVENHDKVSPGMVYGIDFPWSAEMLESWGAEWLTKAFRVAGTLAKDNAVKSLRFEQDVKITTGNNGGKFLFYVEYEKPSPELDTRLFAKVPFALTQKTKIDRMSSSVNKQPQELYEINTYRLLESTLPVKTPRYYFADISNKTSNFIIITARIEFADHAGAVDFGRPTERKAPMAPYEIEGPYDKCIDWNLRGQPYEYYYVLVRVGAQMAGLYKQGRMGERSVLLQNFGSSEHMTRENFGMKSGPSGQPPQQFKQIVNSALKFISDTGKVLFPSYVTRPAFQQKLMKTLLTLSGYSAEVEYWKHADPNYVALAHQNLNVDNAYFWRDNHGALEAGIFDWGGMASSSLGHKLWWWLYCADYEMLEENIDSLIGLFVSSYHEAGGPQLEFKELKSMFLITAMQQFMMLCSAVPQIIRMCPAKEWATIHDRWDPRIAENIDDKSTLRLYLHVMNTVIRFIEEWKADEVLQNWISDFYCGKLGLPRKDEKTILA